MKKNKIFPRRINPIKNNKIPLKTDKNKIQASNKLLMKYVKRKFNLKIVKLQEK